jgi:hypothetical protein
VWWGSRRCAGGLAVVAALLALVPVNALWGASIDDRLALDLAVVASLAGCGPGGAVAGVVAHPNRVDTVRRDRQRNHRGRRGGDGIQHAGDARAAS